VTDYSWSDVYARGVELFGEAPGAQLEQDILEVFERVPKRVSSVVEHVGKQIRGGVDIHSGWAVVRNRLGQAPLEDVRASDADERRKRWQRCRNWIRNAGIYLGREQVAEELKALGVDDEDDLNDLLAYWEQAREGVRERRLELAMQAIADYRHQAEEDSLPEWVGRWKRARARGDGRLFPEQAEGIRQLHDAHLLEQTVARNGVPASGYEREYALLDRPLSDASVWVQPEEYVG